jgi:hypothetical protein
MDKETAKSLRQALDLLKSGDVKSARTMLVEFLKTNPENEQAWYMLSFAVSDQQKQIYSLNQVLRINPSHEKARDRLSKITGKSLGIPEVKDYPREKMRTAQIERPEPPGDLLSQRLFGAVDVPEQKQKETPKIIPEPGKVETLPPHIVGEPEIKPFDIRDEIKSKPVKTPAFNNLLSKIPRRTLVLLTLCVIAGGIVILLSRRNGFFDNSLPSDQSPTNSGSVPTSTYTPLPTPTEIGGALPPTWTPVPPEEEREPFFGEDSIFTIPSLNLPTSEILAEMTNIQNEMLTSRFYHSVKVDSFIASSSEFNHLLSDFLIIPGYQEHKDKRELVYRTLGLINPWDNLNNFLPNLWADPNGDLYLPVEKAIIIESEGFGIIEKYLYARGYAQALIDDEFSIDEFGIYPVCSLSLQRCQALLAFLKGDATHMADEWLNSYGPADQIWRVNDLEVNYFDLPMQSPPFFIEKELDFTHTAGLAFVEALLDHGGEELLNSVYQYLPSTTEQILHPEKYIGGEQAILIDDIPLNSVLDDEWQEILNESIGEWLTYQILSSGIDENARISTEEAQLAAAGWGGDRTQIYYNDTTDQLIVSAYWTWDSPIDADEFYKAISDYINMRYGNPGKFDQSGAECRQAGSESICVIKNSSDVIWLIAPDMTIMDLLLGLYTSGS